MPDQNDPVNNPKHYTGHPSGIECIQLTEHMNFCLGNVVKYIWRSELKDNPFEDLRKAQWYLDREIRRIREKKTVGIKGEFNEYDSDWAGNDVLIPESHWGITKYQEATEDTGDTFFR